MQVFGSRPLGVFVGRLDVQLMLGTTGMTLRLQSVGLLQKTFEGVLFLRSRINTAHQVQTDARSGLVPLALMTNMVPA